MKYMQSKKREVKFPIWGWFYVFFGVLIMANILFVYLANTSFTGVSSDTAYSDGINYNDELARKRKQQDEGWAFSLLYEGGLAEAHISADILPKETLAERIESVVVTFVRPTHEGHDVSYTMDLGVDSVFRTSNVDLPLQGQWDMLVEAYFDGDIYKAKERLMVR